MALRKLRYDGDDLLRKKAKMVQQITEGTKILLDDMKDTMDYYNGVGIAAPQVGILKKIVVISYDDEVYEMINPIVSDADGTQTSDEGCLSIPGKVGTVERPERLKVSYLNRDGENIEIEAEGSLAIIVSHETDHLEGILYKDKALQDTFRDREDDDELDEEYEDKRQEG